MTQHPARGHIRRILHTGLALLLAAATLGGFGTATASAATLDDTSLDTTTQSADAQSAAPAAAAAYPTSLVNGSFYHPDKASDIKGFWWTSINPADGTRLIPGSTTPWQKINGFDRTRFGWSSSQTTGTDCPQGEQKKGAVELQYDTLDKNQYAEITACQAGTYLYQDIDTTNPGNTAYTVRLRHASRDKGHVDSMQVMIGSPGHEQPVEMTRLTSNGHGDKTGAKSTVIATQVANGSANTTSQRMNHADQWETYQGTVIVPKGQNLTRFTFKALDSAGPAVGNLVDDITFTKAYELNYDGNGAQSGSTPGQQAASTAAVTRLTADRTTTKAASTYPTSLVNGDFSYPGESVLWEHNTHGRMGYVYPADGTYERCKPVNGYCWSQNLTRTKINGWNAARFGWATNDAQGQVELRDGPTGTRNRNPHAEITAISQLIDTSSSTPVAYTVSLKHQPRTTNNEKMQVMVGPKGRERPVTMTRVTANGAGDKTGVSSTVIQTRSNKFEDPSSWETYTGTVIIPAGQNLTNFTFKALQSTNPQEGNLIDDVVFTKAYQLAYDGNGGAGSLPGTATKATLESRAGVTLSADKAQTQGSYPSTASMRLFDYTVSKTGAADNKATAKCYPCLTQGINSSNQPGGNLLKFMYNNPTLPANAPTRLKTIMASPLNKYNQYKIGRDWTADRTDGGYPVSVSGGGISQSTRYLFDTSGHAGKTMYTVAKPNLFTWDQASGQYTYDSDKTSASYDTASRSFRLGSANGGFWPFNPAGSSVTRDTANHYFGVAYTQPFLMTENGVDNLNKPLTFNFRGDDDIWITIDDAPILAMSSGLDGHSGSFNLATGQVTQGNFHGDRTETTTIKTLMDKAGITPEGGFNGNTLAANTHHTMKVYYLERGNYGSNLRMSFNLQARYQLTYDPNGGEGAVPGTRRNRTMTTRTAADTSRAAAARTTLPCKTSGAGATGPRAKDFCWIDWTNLKLTDGTRPVRITVPGGHVDADLTLTHSSNATMFIQDYSVTDPQWSRLIPAYKLKGNTAIGFVRKGNDRADRSATVRLSNIRLVSDGTGSSVHVFKDWSMAFGDAETMGGHYDGSDYEQTIIRSDKPISQLGHIGDISHGNAYAIANKGWGTTAVTLAGGTNQPGLTESKGAVIAAANQPNEFTVDFSQHVMGGDSAIAVGLYMPYTTAYQLSYDGNGGNGKVPSNTTAGQLQDAAATSGNRTTSTLGDLASTVVDTTDTGHVESATIRTMSNPISDGRRATVRADGSVIVRPAADTDTYGGCQVYYPEGAKISLASAAKDSDCWDSSMLRKTNSAGNLTFLGWSEARHADVSTSDQATAAGVVPTVTMPKGGKTVFAVWANLPILKYDVNAPDNTTAPTTPGSITGVLNQAVQDKSGWSTDAPAAYGKIKGYKFLGWYTADRGGTPYNWTTPLTRAETTVYAHWQPIAYKIHYDPNKPQDATGDPTGTMGDQPMQYDVKANLTANTYQLTGWKWLGWNTAPDGSGTTYNNRQEVINLTDKDGGEITLYAQWKRLPTTMPATGGTGLAAVILTGVLGLAAAGGIIHTIRRTNARSRQ